MQPSHVADVGEADIFGATTLSKSPDTPQGPMQGSSDTKTLSDQNAPKSGQKPFNSTEAAAARAGGPAQTAATAAAVADAPAGDDSRLARLVRPAHSSGGPTAGLVAKTQELFHRFRETPGNSFKERFDTWYTTRSAESAADATGVTWPSEHITKMWKFFFKAGAGTTDRYGFAIKMGPLDEKSESERAEARARSARSLVNIDPQERARRTTFGLGLASVMVVAAAVMLAQDFASGGLMRIALKAGLFLPFLFGMLLAASGATGLWSIALASIWDVDGTGMQQVPTAQLDLALRKKVVYTFSAIGLVLNALGLAWLVLAP